MTAVRRYSEALIAGLPFNGLGFPVPLKGFLRRCSMSELSRSKIQFVFASVKSVILTVELNCPSDLRALNSARTKLQFSGTSTDSCTSFEFAVAGTKRSTIS